MFSVGWVPALVDIARNELGLMSKTETRTRIRSFKKEPFMCGILGTKIEKEEFTFKVT
jgi:hypothetical protein